MKLFVWIWITGNVTSCVLATYVDTKERDFSIVFYALLTLQIDGIQLNSAAELDELCLCKDSGSKGTFFC